MVSRGASEHLGTANEEDSQGTAKSTTDEGELDRATKLKAKLSSLKGQATTLEKASDLRTLEKRLTVAKEVIAKSRNPLEPAREHNVASSSSTTTRAMEVPPSKPQQLGQPWETLS